MYKRVDIAGGVIVNSKKEILLVHNNSTDSWTFPKGHINPREKLLDAAKREIFEETGITQLQLLCELPVYERFTRQDTSKIKVMHMFLFSTSQTLILDNTSEIRDLKWVDYHHAFKVLSYKEEIELLKNNENKIVC